MAVKSNNRYFRVNYGCITVNNNEGWGSIGVIAADGRYVNETAVLEKLFSIQEKHFPDNPFASVVIQHVQELTEADYLDFYNKVRDKDALNITFSQS